MDIDHCFRKEVFLECTTPSHPKPIPPGVSTDIYDTLDKIQSLYQSSSLTDDLYGPEIESISKLRKSLPTEHCSPETNMHLPIYFDLKWTQAQMAKSPSQLKAVFHKTCRYA